MFYPNGRPRLPDAEIKPVSISSAEEAALLGRGSGSSQRVREAAAALVQTAERPGFRLPMLPATAVEAMSLASDPNTPMKRLEQTISRDIVLAAKVLAVAGSPAFTGRPMRSLGTALQMLGTGAVRDVIHQSVMESHVFNKAVEHQGRALQTHALATARLAKAVCKVVGFDDSQAFVCGLLHDIGALALIAIGRHSALDQCSAAEVVTVQDVVHTTLGARMGAKWKLPDIVIEAIRRHHRFRDWEPGAYSRIGHIIAAADVVADHLGVGCAPRPLGDAEVALICELGVDPANIVDVAQRAFAGGV